MTKLEQMQLTDIAERHGIVGVVAFLCKWSAGKESLLVDGIQQVKSCVASLSSQSIVDRISLWARGEEYRNAR
jgi:hypothetical protein